ncbi:MAG: transcriptional regulator [Lacrimispora sp.]|jgi:DNA-binding MarR family transcriptional regulator|nr:transcriptional regulator [Lacrimispora sp.]
MREQDIISVLSKIRTQANQFIIKKMANYGVYELAPSHGDIIFTLLRKEKITMKDLAGSIKKDKSTVTVLVEKLVRLGYIKKERDVADNRITYLSLTQKGADLKPMFEDISKNLFDTVYQDIPKEEREALMQSLDKINHNFDGI